MMPIAAADVHAVHLSIGRRSRGDLARRATIFGVGMLRAAIAAGGSRRISAGSCRTGAAAPRALIMTLAAAGFVIGVLNASGLSFALTLLLISSPAASLFVLLSSRRW